MLLNALWQMVSANYSSSGFGETQVDTSAPGDASFYVNGAALSGHAMVESSTAAQLQGYSKTQRRKAHERLPGPRATKQTFTTLSGQQ